MIDGNQCPVPLNSPNGIYNEDCLFLNVYTRNLTPLDLKPVVVVIHPGGLYVGSGSSKNMGPQYLLEHDIVLVTFNYRLAIFGFTSTGTEEALGNAGFKDQALVLKWIRDHISHFGGNPKCVTILGNSAGSMSAILHLISPMSENLFHRVILMSGGILPQTNLSTSQNNLIEKFAKLHDCNETKPFDCLKNSDTKTVTESLRRMFEFGWDNPIFPWLPVLEPKINNEEQFLTDEPLELIKNGNFSKVPILLSTTVNELWMSAFYLLQHPDLLNRFFTDFKKLAPICFQYKPNELITDKIWDFYFKESTNYSAKTYGQLEHCFSDALINFPAYRFAEVARHHVDLYYYLFNFKGANISLECDLGYRNICKGKVTLVFLLYLN